MQINNINRASGLQTMQLMNMRQNAARINSPNAGGLSVGRGDPDAPSGTLAALRQNQNGGVSINISKAARVFHAMSMRHGEMNILNASPLQQASLRCETCANRMYVDQSGDSTVSFQSPTNIAPESAASLVMAHESEHIENEREEAESKGREVVSESVSLHTAICPECKRVYVSGGKAETLAVGGQANHNPMNWAESLLNMLFGSGSET